jgi:hypothetical protein
MPLSESKKDGGAGVAGGAGTAAPLSSYVWEVRYVLVVVMVWKMSDCVLVLVL